ncbi:MAG TPA: NAD(P)/FAD-dependent oxidoreductase [Nitrososphaerales archaeon]|nr:NAD(P)/FAD-dependent oxidoreductase [Nitrososphaerales archaeon]
MRIAVVGIGVAGAYLVNRLSKEHDVVGFERMSEESHDSICAWGTVKNVMSDLVRKCDLNFDNYVLHDGLDMRVDAGRNTFDIKLKGLCTYDKIQLIKDMVEGAKIDYGSAPSRELLEKDFDLIVDATGFHRTLLPKPKYELWVPTIQYKVKYDERPYNDFLIKPFPSMSGYFWFFPLENRYAHVGAGDKNRKHIEIVDAFLKKHGGKVLKKVGRPIRLTPPALCEPFIDGKVVGVGESIGTVYALLGEGIIPSTICADLFVDNINDLQRYRKLVLEKFKIYHTVFNFVKHKINDEFSMMKHLPDLIKIYSYMKKQEYRFGMEIRMADMMKITKV